MKIILHRSARRLPLILFAVWLFASPAIPQENLKVKPSGRTVVAEVVALNQPFMVNRLGSSVPTGQIFALRRDVKMIDASKRKDGRKDNNLPSFEEIAANSAPYVGNVTLKDYKRPRPIALRANLGDVLEIRFINLLAPPSPPATPTPSPSVFAGCHVMGLNLLPALPASTNSPNPPPLVSDSSFVGKNTNSFADSQAKNATKVYRYFAGAEGVFILSSAADPTSQNEVGAGLFGSVTIQPPEAEYYRSQTTREDLFYATLHSANLPQNMRLSETDRKNGEGRNIFNLTTYESSQRQHTIANVEVVIKQRVDQLGLKAQTTPATAPAMVQANDFVRELVLSKQIDPEKPNWPAGYLYSAEFGHPIIDYSIAYVPDYHQGEEGDARAGGSPILRMLYPVARGFVKNAAKDLFFRLPGGESDYKRQIEQLDTSILPEGLRTLLEQNWGVAFTDETRVAPERSYLPDLPAADLDTIKKQVPSAQFPGLSSIWLLTGVNYKGNNSASILIQGNVDPQGIARLFFLETELQLFHSDPMAIITGPQAGRFRYSENSPSFYETPASPDRRQPYREFALAYHNTNFVIQAFPQQQPKNPLQPVNSNGTDGMAINYGIAAIGTEILANRLGVGPMGVNGDGADLKFEEFFLSAWACGDPAMVVDRPANTPDPPVPPNAAVTFKAAPPPSQWVQANSGQAGTKPPAKGRATKVFFPDDPSNVYHSYMRDHVKMRIYNAGINAPHVHHLHAHQWTRSPNSDEGQYLDSELITPGSAFSLEMVYNGSGNRNQTVGDSIFHCHFYPHFARGMWALWRVHDVFEEGTLLDANGKVATSQPPAADADPDLNAHLSWVRALPDGEIHNGTPIPAVIPLPSLGIAPAPARVRVAGIPQIPAQPAGGAGTVADLKAWVPNLEGDQSKGRTIEVQPEFVFERDPQGNILRAKDTQKFIYKLDDKKQRTVYLNKNGTPIYKNPGFPFFVPGVAGHRPPHPPLDMGWEEDKGVPILENGKPKYLDGGLPRHVVLGGKIVREFHTKWDFTKDFIRYKTDSPAEANEENAVDGALVAYVLPEGGTPIEQAAMFAHAIRTHRTSQPDGTAGNFIHNGLPPTHGAPFADPGIDDNGNAVNELRRYRAAVIQKDVVLNKQGWHYPQQRMLTLWQDVKPTFDEKRPPQPFFFRANGGETVEYWHTNLVPDYYELDDFQVRTPTDIIGQHIHLVKFDVTSSDGAENGFNYEDGTYSPDEVRGRIFALTRPWADGSYRKLNDKTIKERKYDLFAFKDDPKGTVGIDWSQWAQPEKASEPTKWNGSYLQWQMSQEKEPLKGNPPNPITAAFRYLEPPPTQNWDGAMTTIQRFSTDPLLNNEGHDRTVRTVFTHDHFGPSTHQQIGLYGGLLVEPPNSRWLDPVTGGFYYDTVTRTDGGPTGWESIIEMPNPADSYREFALEFQDLQLAYTHSSRPKEGPIWSEDSGNVTANPALFPITTKFTPPPAEGSAVSPELADDFAKNGITLARKPTTIVIPDKTLLNTWNVFDPVNYGYGAPDNPEKSFVIVSASPAASPTTSPSFNVVTPNLKTWADPGSAVGPPQPKLSPPIISNGGGTYSLNYRNELLNNKGATNAIQQRRNSSPSTVTDDSFDFASVQRDKPNTTFFDTQVPPPSPVFPPPWVPQPSGSPNVNGVPPPPLFNRPLDPAKVNGPWLDPVGVVQGTGTGGDGTGVNAGQISTYDPYTPLLRAYQNDRVQVRSLVGAHTAVHSFMIQGLKWLYEPSNNEAGYRNAQPMGLSEHFEMIFRMPPATTGGNGRNFADYLYAPSSGTTGLSNGVWGLMRSFDVDAPLKTVPQPSDSSAKAKQSLYPLPKTANARPVSAHPPTKFNYPDLDSTDLPWVEFQIEATPRTITFNDRVTSTPTATPGGTAGPTPTPAASNPNGILYVLKKVTVHAKGAGKPTEIIPEKSATGDDPLILRVKAGSWIIVSLANSITPTYTQASTTIGLHPQLLAFDMNGSNGANIGFNNNQTVPPAPLSPTPGASGSPTPAPTATPATYYWYAGDFEYDRTTGDLLLDPTTKVPRGQPSELGAINLVGSDPFNQEPNGLAGALIVEPENVWLEGSDYFGASAAIHAADNSGGVPKKGGFLFQECVVIEQIDLQNVNGGKIVAGVNNRSEDFSLRTKPPNAAIFSNSSGGGADPKTPVFTAPAGKPVRFRVLMPGADTNPTVVFELHGHSWREEPFVDRSRKLGDNAKSQVFGSQILVPHQGLNLLIDRAGGPDGTPGDYLFSNYLARGGTGAWGILRVVPEKGK